MSQEFTQLNTQIQYKILKDGVGETPLQNQEVYFYFICRDSKNNFVSGSQHQATRCVIGRNMLDNQLEEIIKIMRQGDRAQVQVQDGNDFLLFELEIIRFGQIQKFPWQLQGEELYEHSTQLKTQATDYFKAQKFFNQKYKQALSSYQSALRLISKDYGPRQKELQTQLKSNICLCALKLQDWDTCIAQATSVLEEDPNNVKILHRRAVAKSEKGDSDEARIDLNKALLIDSQNKEIQKELDNIALKEKKIKEKQSALYKKMLFGE